MPGLMGTSKWAPGGDNSQDDGDTKNSSNRKNNGNPKAPSGSKPDSSKKRAGNEKSSAPHDDSTRNGRNDTPSGPANSRRTSEKPQHAFYEGRRAPQDVERGEYRSAARPGARGPDLAIRPAGANAHAPVPKLRMKSAAVRIVGSTASALPVTLPATGTARAEDGVEQAFTTGVSGRSDTLVNTPSTPARIPAPAAITEHMDSHDIAPGDHTTSPTMVAEHTLAPPPSAPSTHPFANTTFCIPPQGPLSDADFVFLLFKLRGRKISSQDWMVAVQQVQGVCFGQAVEARAGEMDTCTPLPTTEMLITGEKCEERVEEREVVGEKVGEMRRGLDEEFARLMGDEGDEGEEW